MHLFLLSLLALSAPMALAGENPEAASPKTVVELFTSQGCSSCPPANRFVGELADDPDKLVLSYGVTYWDYLGWKDTFASADFTKRQKDYSRSLGIGYSYTPQIILNGEKHNSRYSKRAVEKAAIRASDIDLDLSVKDNHLSLKSSAPKTLIVTYTPGWQSVPVARGENHGRTLRIANVVNDIQWVKTSGLTHIKIKDGLAYAALVHDPVDNRVVAASVVTP